MTIFKLPRGFAMRAFIGAALLSIAQTSTATRLPAPPATDQDKADIAAIIKASKPGVPMALDMSNPQHYRFFTHQMASVGVTPDRYPQLFKLTNAARTSKPPKVETRSMSELAAAHAVGDPAPGDAVVPIQTLTSLGSTDGVHYSVSALSSVPSPYYSAIQVGIYDTNGNTLGQPVSVTSATLPASNLNAVATGTSPSAGAAVVGMETYFYQDQYGKAYHGTVQGTVTSAPSSITNLAPMPGSGQLITVLCLGRTGTNCTYSPPGGTGGNVVMPVQGNIVFSSPISTDASTQSAVITMAKPDTGQGGGCTIASTTSFFGDPNTVINGNTITWNFPNMQFQSASGCLTANSTAIYTFTLGLTVGTQPTYVTITSDPTTDPTNPYFKKIPELQVFFSCVAEGTLVTLKGGKKIKIESLQAGQEVVVDASGRTEVVESKLRGKEVVPIIVLQTARHRALKVTDGHPVITDKGPVLAGNLKVGDMVMTQNGPDKLTRVSRQKFNGYVWNLNIGAPPASLNDTKVTGATFLAGDIVVGDNVMQFVENRKSQATYATRALHNAPAEWARDLQSAMEDAAAK